MALADIDAATTQRRIQDAVEASRKAFAAHAQRSAEIDAASREAAAREEADLKAVRERRAEVEAQKAATKQEEQKPRPKRGTLSLGAEEFKLDRDARKAAGQAQPARPAGQTQPAPPGQAAPPRPAPAEQAAPARKRPPRPEVDDDMSGRTWLR
ncbi:hypothetical protein [Actinophytocola sp.]|uniref:hypothetical protein n=1 Tax=Actinophytocola sp. TaxID=1872138 RepID=UPI002ED5C951